MTDISQLRRLANQRKVLEFYLAPAPLEEGEGWLVMFKNIDGEMEVLTKARSKIHRVYKYADAAINTINEFHAHGIEAKIVLS